MPLERPGRRSFAPAAAFLYLYLCSIYLVYWSHAGYFVDDWFLTKQFRQAAASHAAGAFVLAVIQNNVYKLFRLHWLSLLVGYAATMAGGYSARFNFAFLLLLHAACAWLLSQALWRSGTERGLAFLAGAFYLLAPTAHFGLFVNFTNPFIVLPAFWTLLMFYIWSGPLSRGECSGPTTAALCACAAAGLFSGEQGFLLLWGILPLTMICFLRRRPLRGGLRAILGVWIVLACAAGVYLLWINRAPAGQTGLRYRYDFTWEQFRANIRLLFGTEMTQLSGAGAGALFHISPGAGDLILALAAGLLAAGLMWAWRRDRPAIAGWWRVWLFAAAGAAAAYLPVMWIRSDYSRFRYHYEPTPYLAVAAAALCWLPARGRRLPLLAALLGGALTGYFALNTAADIRQCWIPESQQNGALESALRRLRNVQPGDILVVSGAPYEIGTAQHFSMHSPVSAGPFVEWATGVAPLEAGFDLLDVHGRLLLYQRLDMGKHLNASDLLRTHLLVSSRSGNFSTREWVAFETRPDQFELLPLKEATEQPRPAEIGFSRDQLAMMADHIYFPRSTPLQQ